MPSESLWVQYGIVGILIMAAGTIASAFYKLWHELLSWTEMQDTKRENEREKQRVWQAKQDEIRDIRWQEFLRGMQDELIEQDTRHTKTLDNLVQKIEILIISINNHDVWVRAKDRE